MKRINVQKPGGPVLVEVPAPVAAEAVAAPAEALMPVVLAAESADLQAAGELTPYAPAEAVNPDEERKIGPWGVHRDSKGLRIDRDIAESATRASDGLYFTLEDKGYGTLHIVISGTPKGESTTENQEATATTATADAVVDAAPSAEAQKEENA